MRTYNVRLWHNVRQAQYLNIEAESLEDAKAKALKAYQDFLAYIDAPYLEREDSSYKWEEEGEDDELAFAAALDPVTSIEEDAGEEGGPGIPHRCQQGENTCRNM